MIDNSELNRLIDHYKDCKRKLDESAEVLFKYLGHDKTDDSNNPNLLTNQSPCDEMVITNSGGLPICCSNCGGNVFKWDGQTLLCGCGTPKTIEDEKLYVSWRNN